MTEVAAPAARTPPWRDVRAQRVAGQVLFVVVAVLVAPLVIGAPFWSAFAATQTAYFFGWFIFGGTQSSVGGTVGAIDWFRMMAPLAGFLILVVVRKRVLDYIVPLALIAFYAWRYWPQTLSG